MRARLVESVLLRLPLPAIYLAENEEDQLEVIDGKQRLTTLFAFMDDGFPLQNLSSSEEFHGRFTALPKKLQRRIEDFSLNVFILRKGADPDVKYHLFDRLNRGSVALNAMEIRNGIFRGAGLDLVTELAGDFRAAFGARRAWKRMLAEELTLRAIAFQHQDLWPYEGDMRVYLNRTLRRLNRMSAADLAYVRVVMKHWLELVTTVHSSDALCRVAPDGSTIRQISAAVLDTLAAGYAGRPTVEVVARAPALVARLLALYRDQSFVESLTLGTNDLRRVAHRTGRWAQEVDDALAAPP